MRVFGIYKNIHEISERLEFHENRVKELTLTKKDPSLLESHKKKVERFEKLLSECAVERLINGGDKIDITKIT
ncbi:hypothetical protein MKX79_13280 [Viridibacillus sp. FSL R5-0468]|uniref:hypothetical protein n=1 Tax=Viridibacillus sp. FSL R5-0468 TaxID=2921640 RepID=UPI0030FB916B